MTPQKVSQKRNCPSAAGSTLHFVGKPIPFAGLLGLLALRKVETAQPGPSRQESLHDFRAILRAVQLGILGLQTTEPRMLLIRFLERLYGDGTFSG